MKDRIMLKSIGAVALVLICVSAVFANPFPPKGKWEYLGSKNIGHAYDKDVIDVDNYRELYSAIELRTDKKQIDLHRCVIYFQNGDRQDVRLRRDNRGSESHVIELEGGGRAIDRIAIWGSRDYGKIFRAFDKGTVEFWGKVAKGKRDRDQDTQYYSSRYNDSNWDNDRSWNFNFNNQYSDRARRDRERARRDRERAQRDRERAQRDRDRARRDRDRRDRERRDRDRDRRRRVCP